MQSYGQSKDSRWVTDPKNLEYLFSPRKLTEQHERWSVFINGFNFKLTYRKGSENERADGLPRRDKDMPDKDDKRVLSRTIQLLADEKRPKPTKAPEPVLVLLVVTRSSSLPEVPKEPTRQTAERLAHDDGLVRDEVHEETPALGRVREHAINCTEVTCETHESVTIDKDDWEKAIITDKKYQGILDTLQEEK
jgi:hypothetical protein